MKRHFAGLEYFTTSIRLHAADVNNSMNINTTDAVKITRRFVGLDTLFTRPDWLFENSTGGDTVGVSQTLNDTVIVNGANTVQDLKALCEGDVNGSYGPPSYFCNLITPPKASPKVEITNDEVIKLGQGEYGEIPIRVTEGMNVGAISLILDYPSGKMTIEGVQLADNSENSEIYYSTKGDELRIGWFADDKGKEMSKDEALLKLEVKTTENFMAGDRIELKVVNSSLCELADEKESR